MITFTTKKIDDGRKNIYYIEKDFDEFHALINLCSEQIKTVVGYLGFSTFKLARLRDIEILADSLKSNGRHHNYQFFQDFTDFYLIWVEELSYNFVYPLNLYALESASLIQIKEIFSSFQNFILEIIKITSLKISEIKTAKQVLITNAYGHKETQLLQIPIENYINDFLIDNVAKIAHFKTQ